MKMKLRLRKHETRETLKLELADTSTLHDLRRRINPAAPSSVHLSLNRKDELLAPSPEDTLRSLGVASGDLIYYSLDHSPFLASAQSGESSGWKLGDYETQVQQSESHKALVQDSMGIGFAEVDVVKAKAKSDLNSGMEDLAGGSMGESSGMDGPEPMDVEELDVELAAAESKRLSEPFFLKKVILGKSGDTSELTTLALSVHAVMLESGFVLLDHGSDKLSFSKELLSVSLRYTLPELITRKDTSTVESVTLRFQNIGPKVVVYGTLGGSRQRVHMTCLDKRRFVRVIDLVMDTLKFEKESSSSFYREVFVFWRMVKDGLAIPLLIGLCDKAGLESPPCLMRLPTELKLKILESLPGVSIGNMACVCTEMRYLASDNDMWKQKCLEEPRFPADAFTGDSVDWKRKFASFCRQEKRIIDLRRKNAELRQIRDQFPQMIGDPRNPRFPQMIGDPRNPRFPQMIGDHRDPFSLINGDRLQGYIRLLPGQPGQPGQPGRGYGRRTFGQSFTPRCNLERRD